MRTLKLSNHFISYKERDVCKMGLNCAQIYKVAADFYARVKV